jgi:hypothetical protein
MLARDLVITHMIPDLPVPQDAQGMFQNYMWRALSPGLSICNELLTDIPASVYQHDCSHFSMRSLFHK